MKLNPGEIQEVLSSLGYTLTDKGAYWQTNALFRNGDNKTALQIYKDSGVWRDYVAQTPPMPFRALLEAHLGTNSDKEINKYLKSSERGSFYKTSEPETKIEMEEVYSLDQLAKLLPHYKFYNNKGVSSSLLKTLRAGLATQGQMYQRFVFPIFNQHGQIHGFAGRDMASNADRPKWKHIGKKTQWVYPLHLHSEVREAIAEKGVILVESIGDMLNLMEHGFLNVLVTFGLDVSPQLICSLIGLSPPSITLALNNDKNHEINRGLVGCCKNFLKLLNHFDPEFIKICLPLKNDFGDMDAQDFENWRQKVDKTSFEAQHSSLLEYINKFHKAKLISNNLYKNIKILNNL